MAAADSSTRTSRAAARASSTLNPPRSLSPVMVMPLETRRPPLEPARIATDGRPCGVAPIAALAVGVDVASTSGCVVGVFKNLRRRERGRGSREV